MNKNTSFKLFLKRFPKKFVPRAKSFLTLIFFPILPKTDKIKCYAFMGRHDIDPGVPYKWTLEYKKMHHTIQYNAEQFPYILHKGKKLFFPASWDEQKCKRVYDSLLIEQDARSPHLYVKDIKRLTEKTLLDIGSAEAIFALETIELTKHVYLFECEDEWIDALNMTFAPYKDKITIIKKYVSNNNNDDNVTLDEFFKDKDKSNIFIKMDIEGEEQKALEGAKTLLQQKDLDFAICIYHKKDDAQNISKIFSDYGFVYEFSDGYMNFEMQLRKGVIRKV